MLGAALLGITGADEAVSDWAADKSPLFGHDAADASDTLRDISKFSYLVTGLVAPSGSLQDKAKGFLVGASALALNEAVTGGMKSITARERPDHRDKRSFPSGHASYSSTAATLAVANLNYMPMPGWARTGMTIGLYSVAGGTAWARVEAQRHHVTDVLVGYALGHFVASFMQEAFFGSNQQQPAITFTPLGSGGAVTLQLPLKL
jgi:hypothetical protein